MTEQGIGAAVRRKEDFRFVRGRGKYTDDINLPNQAYAAIVRSPMAHATIAGIDKTAAEAAPGVIGVLTAADFAAFGGLPCGWLVTGKGEKPMVEPKHPILAEGKVRHVGDPVAVVVATSRSAARDAADLVRHRADLSGVALSVDVPAAGAVVTGARNELGQAVLNLLVNALDALDERGTQDPVGPRIFLEVERGDEHVILRVRDNGPGVPKQELERVADLFYPTKGVGEGSGEGLALLPSTVASHGGELEFHCEDGRGLTVEIHLRPAGPGS